MCNPDSWQAHCELWKLLTFLNTGWKTVMWKLITKNIESDLFPLSAPQKGSYMAPVWKNDNLRIKSFAPPTWKEFLRLCVRQTSDSSVSRRSWYILIKRQTCWEGRSWQMAVSDQEVSLTEGKIRNAAVCNDHSISGNREGCWQCTIRANWMKYWWSVLRPEVLWSVTAQWSVLEAIVVRPAHLAG